MYRYLKKPMNQEEELERLRQEILTLKKELSRVSNLTDTDEIVNAMTKHEDCELKDTEEERERCRLGKLPYDPDGWQ